MLVGGRHLLMGLEKKNNFFCYIMIKIYFSNLDLSNPRYISQAANYNAEQFIYLWFAFLMIFEFISKSGILNAAIM